MFFGSTAVTIFILLGLMWLLQLFLTYQQMKRFYGRVRLLRKTGMLAVGVAGGQYKGRAYAVLVIDPDTRIITHAEKLSGWTVFAGLKKIKGGGGVGHLLDDLLDGRVRIEAPEKVVLAMQNAAADLRRALDGPSPEELAALQAAEEEELQPGEIAQSAT